MTAVRADVDLRLLGPVRVWRGGAEVAAGSGRQAAVLCVLALHRGRAVHRDELVAAVWGENPPASALGNVYSYVSGLRRVLEPQRGRSGAGQLLGSNGGTYRLDVPDDAVDVFRFEKLREHGCYRRAAADAPAELSALAGALSLWHGDALAGVPGPYAAAQRARLAELRLATVERHAALLLELGRHDEAIVELRELVDAYPLQEKFYGLLMTALHAGGRRAEAMSTYRYARRLLGGVTGAGPGVVLQDAYERVTGAAATGPGAAVTVPGPAPREPVLLGRGAEVRLLRQAMAQVVAGTGGHVRLEGGPGIGKSALLDAALRQPGAAGYRLGWGRGGDSPSRRPLGLLADCLDNVVSGAEQPWGPRLRSAVADGPDGPDGAELVAAAVAAVRDACDEGPLILVIDDLQWADDATISAWAALQHLTARLPLLLVAAARPDRTALAGLGWHGAMPLGPLSATEASDLVDAV